jgi:hypothetical protein
MLDPTKSAATEAGSNPEATPAQGTHATSYGLADVLFPAVPPKPKGARLVLGVIGTSEIASEELQPPSPEPAPLACEEGMENGAGTALPEVARATDHTRTHPVPPPKRRGNKAVRNRSLLIAAGWT